MKLWWNGKIIDEYEAVITPFDHGFLYGIGLFETFRTYGGKPFLLDRHIARLRSGCEELRIAYAPDKDAIESAISEALQANGLDDGYIRWSVSAGVAPLGLPPATGYPKPNVAIMAKALPPPPSGQKELHLLQLPRSTPEGGIRRKSFHYMNNVLGKWELAERTSSTLAEGLFVDAEGTLVEGVVSNLFWVGAGGRLFTPSLDTGCLPGVTRDIVIELAKQAGIPVVEGRFAQEALYGAEEVFVTNSVQELSSVGALYDTAGKLLKQWPGTAGSVTERLQLAYGNLTK